MALIAEAGVFQSPTTTGNQTVTLDPTVWGSEAPKAIIFSGGLRSADSIGSTSAFNFGMAVSDTSQITVSVVAQDNLSSTLAYRRHSPDQCISHIWTDHQLIEGASFVSSDPAEFTVNWTTANAAQYKYNYLAIGGSGVQVKMTAVRTPAAPATVNYTGIGFKPDCLILCGAMYETEAAATVDHMHMTIGFATSGNSSSTTLLSYDNLSSSDSNVVLTDSLIKNQNGYDPTTFPDCYAQLASLNADGFSLLWNKILANRPYYWILAVKGVTAKVITGSQAISTGNQDTALGFAGEAGILLSAMNVASTGVMYDATLSCGFLDGESNQSCCGFLSEHGVSTSNESSFSDSNEIIKTYDTSQTLTGAATGSFPTTNLRLNWTTTDGTARSYAGIILGNEGENPASVPSSTSDVVAASGGLDVYNSSIIYLPGVGRQVQSRTSVRTLTCVDNNITGRMDNPRYYKKVRP